MNPDPPLSRAARLAADGLLADAWSDSAERLGADPALALPSARELAERYADPGRGYHGSAHIAAVLRDVDALAPADLHPVERAAVDAAACAHDVVYDGVPGQDETLSAQWAQAALTGAGAPADAAQRVAQLILATADHKAPVVDGEPDEACAVLLAVLAGAPADYARYVRQVRREYSSLSEQQWRSGRANVLRGLLANRQLFQTPRGRVLWEDAARANMLSELRTLI
jgi:predicted metal-dependent HD superfamily phosphohydrolase